MKKKSSGGCSSFLFMLFVIFIILKVAGAVAWSWWWVTAPLWMPAALGLAVMALMAVMGASVYKIVSTVLRRQDFGRSGDREGARPGSREVNGQVVEAEGTEVTSARSHNDPKGLPQATSSDGDEDWGA